MKSVSWSYSSLSLFESCAKRYYHLKVAKDVVEVPIEAAAWGTEVHGHLENRVRSGTPLPESIEYMEHIVRPIVDHEGEKLVEHKLTINSNLSPTGWVASDAWCRAIIDVGVLTGNKALLLDWKTGKRKPESTQLMLSAGLAFAHFPNVDTVRTAFVWLKTGQVDSKTYTRDEAPVIWREFVPRVQRLERAFREGNFKPKPSGLCRNWCPVPKHLCTFSGKQ